MTDKIIWLSFLVLFAGCNSASDTGVYFKINGYQGDGASHLAIHVYRSETAEGTPQEVTLEGPVVRALSTDGYRLLLTLQGSQSGMWYSLSVVTMNNMGEVLSLGTSSPVQVQSGHIRGVEVQTEPVPPQAIILPSGSLYPNDRPDCLAMPWDLDCDGYPASDSPYLDQAPEIIRALPSDCDDTNREVNPARVDLNMHSDMDCTMVTERWCWTYEPYTGQCHYGGFSDTRGCMVSDASSTFAPNNFCIGWGNLGTVQEESVAVLCYLPKDSEIQIVPSDQLLQAYNNNDSECESQVLGIQNMSAWFGYEYEQRSWGACDSPLSLRLNGDGWGMATVMFMMKQANENIKDRGQTPTNLRALKVLLVPRRGLPECMSVDVVPSYDVPTTI